MSKAYSYACRDCEGMAACPARIVAETRDEVWQLMGHHARIAHDENPADWDQETKDYLETLVKEVDA